MRSDAARAIAAAAGLLALASLSPAVNAQTLHFAPRLFTDTPHTANVVDADGDGRLEIPGLFKLAKLGRKKRGRRVRKGGR